MKLSERKQIKHKYGSKLYSDETIDKVIELFYTSKNNSSTAIGEIVGLKASQILNILNQYDENVKKYERERL